MIFQKSSTRTRVSFETGMYQLGGQALFLSNRDLQIGRGEPVQDTARVLSRYLDGIMIRTYEQKEVEDLAGYGTIPIINGLTDFCHPCQVLADLMTIREKLRGTGRAEDVLHRRWQQHGQLPDRRRPQDRHEGIGCHPRGLPSPIRRSWRLPAPIRISSITDDPMKAAAERGCGHHGHLGLHGHGS